MRIDVIDERTLDRRHPDLDSCLRGTLESLDLVTVVMRDQGAADPVDAERIELIEGGSGPEVDERTASTILNEVDVAGIGEAVQVLADALSVNRCHQDAYAAAGSFGMMTQQTA
jgi:hypothetical protein